jgi:hypothetical protein
LICAIENVNIAAIRRLLKAGVNPTARVRTGSTALTIARNRLGCRECQQALEIVMAASAP